MRRILDKHNNFGTLFSARTARFEVVFTTEESFEPYDGDDEGGEIASALASGELVMFDSKVSVECDGVTLASAYLGMSVYKSGEVLQFLRDGYFRDMLGEVCDAARAYTARVPHLRTVA